MAEFNRRQFTRLSLALPLTLSSASARAAAAKKYIGGLTDLEGLRVGHFTERRRPTGCTVVLAEDGAIAGVDVRGSAPGTRETDLLEPRNTVERVDAVLLSGGSAFGLDAASGVMQYLEEKGVGFPTQAGRVPIVPAAILYDLQVGEGSIRPDRLAGYRACKAATSGPVPEGNVGAGTGATVGKLLGRPMKGGLGSAAIHVGDLVVAALAAVNAVGDVIDPATGHILAGARTRDGRSFLNLARQLRSKPLRAAPGAGENTTLAVVGTNATFRPAQMQKIAQMAHDGLARTINPVHMPYDGDTIFSLSTARRRGFDLGQVGALAAEVVALAVIRAVLQARGIPGYPSHADLR